MSIPSLISQNEPKYDVALGVYISLGSNQSYNNMPSKTLLLNALESLAIGGDQINSTSSFWVSDAWPKENGAPQYINAVCCISPYDTEPAQLMQRLHDIEAKFGRVRDVHNRWLSRTLDLDLLDYNGLISKNHSFPVLPHPRIADRDFVLKPLLEISSHWCHPVTGTHANVLLDNLVSSGNTHNCKLLDDEF